MRKLSITQAFKSVSKKFLAAFVALLIIASPMTALAAWGPDRPTFDYNDSVGRKGSQNGPVFNSFINAPNYGDERNFVTVSDGDKATWVGSVAGQVDKEVQVRAYVHNNANQDTNASGKGVAVNTRVRFYIPTGLANSFDVAGYVSADNAAPGRVYDTANVVNQAQAFSLSYVPGSAKLYNNGPFKNGVAVSDDVVGQNGAQIGYDALNGSLPGCFDYKAVVIIRVKVKAPKLQLSKKVTVPGSSTWSESLKAKKGDTVSWLIDYKNTGSEVINNLTIRDAVPAGLTVVPGSITWFDAARPNGQQLADTALGSAGVNLGNYAPNGGGYIRFRTVVGDLKDCVAKNVAYGRGDSVKEVSDDAVVTQENCKPPVDKCPTNPSLPKDSPECTVCPTNPNLPKNSPKCTVCPYNPNLPKDSKDCVKPPVTTIPSTGIGGIVTGLLGSSAAAYGAYAYVESRRTLKKLIGRQ